MGKVHIRSSDEDPKCKLIIAAIHHVGKMMANYALGNTIASIIKNDTSLMKWLP